MGVTPRLLAAALAALVVGSSLAGGQPPPGAPPQAALAPGEWPAYGATYAEPKYSPSPWAARTSARS